MWQPLHHTRSTSSIASNFVVECYFCTGLFSLHLIWYMSMKHSCHWHEKRSRSIWKSSLCWWLAQKQGHLRICGCFKGCRELHNAKDHYAVAVYVAILSDGTIAGHLPGKISCVRSLLIWYLLLVLFFVWNGSRQIYLSVGFAYWLLVV